MKKSASPHTAKRPAWNSGRRQWRGWAAEVRRLRAEQQALDVREHEMRERYGTDWPQNALKEYVEEVTHLQGELRRIEDMRWESFFPSRLVAEIEENLACISVEEQPQLLDALWVSVKTLIERRDAAAQRGEPVLSVTQRLRLRGVASKAFEFVRTCEPIKDTQTLIGGWAAGGILNGLTLEQLVQAVGVLTTAISTRLSQAGSPRDAHRPPDNAFHEFCVDVAVALAEAGEPVKTSRTGSMARVLTTLLSASGQRVPVDLLRHIKKAATTLASERRRRRRDSKKLERFLSVQ